LEIVLKISVIVAEGAETWKMTKRKEQALLIFERKIFRRIYGPKYEDVKWRSRTNRELEEISRGKYVVKWIKVQKIVDWITWREWRRIGSPKRSSLKELEGTKRRERPRKGWREEGERDF
jgi:hypothetical protein